MSYDVTVYDGPACPTCGHCGGVLMDWSPTYNYAPMFAAAGFSLRDFNSKTGAEVAAILAPAVAAMAADPEKFTALEASNGWGTYETVMPYLRKLLSIVTERPGCTAEVT